MKIYLIKHEKQLGPFSRSEIMAMIRSGKCKMNDCACREGCREKLSLSEIFAKQQDEMQGEDGFFLIELLQIAKLLDSLPRLTVSALLSPLAYKWGVPAFACIFGFLIFHLIIAAKCHDLAVHLRKNRWEWTFAALIPVVNLLPIWRLLTLATKALKNQGVAANQFGVADTAMKNLEEAANASQ